MSKTPKVERNMSTPESRAFWELPDHAREIATWPAWRRAGINVSVEPEPQRTSESAEHRKKET